MLQRLFDRLCVYQSDDLLATIAALQLVPLNAHRLLRLEAYAHAAASSRIQAGCPRITYDELKQLAKDDPLTGTMVHMAEDPCGNLFTESIMFQGGGYVVFPGITNGSPFILKHLCKAIFLAAKPFPDNVFAWLVGELVGASLCLSDLAARRADLKRWTAVPSPESDGIAVPSADDLCRLKRAVIFTRAELFEALRERGHRSSALRSLTVRRTDFCLADWAMENAPLLRTPLISSGDSLIIAVPGMVLSATIRAVLKIADDRRVVSELADRYTRAVWDTVRQSLGFLSMSHAKCPLPPLRFQNARDAVFSIDTDKVTHVLLVTDPMDNLGHQSNDGPLERTTLCRQIDERLCEVERWLAEGSRGTLNDITHLVILQGIGRDEMYEFEPGSRPVSPGLFVTADELEIIAMHDSLDPLVLWKFVRTRERTRARTEICVFDTLDEYALYVEKQHGYYITDDRRPDNLSIQTGYGVCLRRKVLQGRDFHAALSYNQGSFLEVEKVFNTGNVPIYAPVMDVGRRASKLIEGFAAPVWVLSPEFSCKEEYNLGGDYYHLVESIAYWLWQLTPAIAVALKIIAERHKQVQIHVKLPAEREWRAPRGPVGVASDVCRIEVKENVCGIQVEILPALASALMSADNKGERCLVRQILEGIRQLLPDGQEKALDDAHIASGIDTYAPLGLKKKFFTINTATNPALHPAPGLPSFRKVQEADTEWVLDDVGKFLVKTRQLPIGPIPPEHQDAVLRDVVGCLYGRVVNLTASLSSNGLLEALIAHNERMTLEWERLRLTLPTRVACFSNEEEVLDDLREQIPAHHMLRLASRFLIEYVAACPPRGFRPWSLSVYDELIALAAAITDFGALSDLTHFKIEDLRWSVLESERLGWSREGYLSTRGEYLKTHVVCQLDRARGGFAGHWRDRKRQRTRLVDDIDKATKAELGVPLADIMDVFSMAMTIGLKENAAVSVWKEKDLRRRLADELDWADERVDRTFKLLTLTPRDRFLDPPGFRREDVYPWRLDRQLSYIRRPFVIRLGTQGREVLWGFREIDLVGMYWIDALLYGRVQARSRELKELVSKLHNKRGREFNDLVADTLQRYPELVVKRRVKKIGSLQPPGDIDVLLAIPAKRRLLLIECKDLEVARMPHEIRSELMKVFEGKNGRPSAVQKHLRRLEWVKEHATDVLNHLGCNDGGDWKVEALFVTDTEMMTPLLRDAPVRFVPIAQIEDIL